MPVEQQVILLEQLLAEIKDLVIFFLIRDPRAALYSRLDVVCLLSFLILQRRQSKISRISFQNEESTLEHNWHSKILRGGTENSFCR